MNRSELERRNAARSAAHLPLLDIQAELVRSRARRARARISEAERARRSRLEPEFLLGWVAAYCSEHQIEPERFRFNFALRYSYERDFAEHCRLKLV